MQIANKPSASYITSSPWRFNALAFTFSLRGTNARCPGIDKQPSSMPVSPSLSKISGLINTTWLVLSPSMSMVITRFNTPTCGAASPMPSCSYIVSNISSINWFNSASTFATGSHTVASRSSGYKTTSNTAIFVISLENFKRFSWLF